MPNQCLAANTATKTDKPSVLNHDCVDVRSLLLDNFFTPSAVGQLARLAYLCGHLGPHPGDEIEHPHIFERT